MFGVVALLFIPPNILLTNKVHLKINDILTAAPPTYTSPNNAIYVDHVIIYHYLSAASIILVYIVVYGCILLCIIAITIVVTAYFVSNLLIEAVLALFQSICPQHKSIWVQWVMFRRYFISIEVLVAVPPPIAYYG